MSNCLLAIIRRGDLWSPVFYFYINFSTGCRGTYFVPAIDAISLLPRADGIRPYIIRNKFNVILSVSEESLRFSDPSFYSG